MHADHGPIWPTRCSVFGALRCSGPCSLRDSSIHHLTVLSPKLCDKTLFGNWKEITFAQGTATTDRANSTLWPNAVARFRLYAGATPSLCDLFRDASYLPQGQPWCNSSVLVRADGDGDSFYTEPNVLVTRVSLSHPDLG